MSQETEPGAPMPVEFPIEVLSPEAVAQLLGAPASGGRYAVVHFGPGAEGDYGWTAQWHHDVDGALRSMRYLAQKVAAGYSADDPRGRKVVASIERHVATLEQLKATLLDHLIPR